jgi:5'-nucleotidase (lipoprotein e(P4) family)
MRCLVLTAAIATACGCSSHTVYSNSVESCTVASVETSEPVATFAGATVPLQLHWYRVSAERALLYAQTYRLACERIYSRLPDLRRNVWGVVVDADETILDNSELRGRLATRSPPAEYSLAEWDKWVKERRATLLPGAKQFVEAVRVVGGKVFVVTNRSESQCDDTRANFDVLGLSVDAVLCQTTVSDKNPRFQSIRDGTAVSNIGPVHIAAFVGDNVMDFPNESQSTRASSRFGGDYFLLPNPTYGSFDDVAFH